MQDYLNDKLNALVQLFSFYAVNFQRYKYAFVLQLLPDIRPVIVILNFIQNSNLFLIYERDVIKERIY
jgi:hypothetical protein